MPGPSPDGALQCDGGREFVFHLDKRSAHLRHARGEALDHLGGRSNGISGGESSAGCQSAFTAGMVAIDEVCAGEYSSGISFFATSLGRHFGGVDGEIGAIHPAQVTTTAFFRCTRAADGSPYQ